APVRGIPHCRRWPKADSRAGSKARAPLRDLFVFDLLEQDVWRGDGETARKRVEHFFVRARRPVAVLLRNAERVEHGLCRIRNEGLRQDRDQRAIIERGAYAARGSAYVCLKHSPRGGGL